MLIVVDLVRAQDPPLVSVSFANSSRTWPDLRRADHLGVTVLADYQGETARQLAGPSQSRFDGLAVSVTEAGAVTLTDGLVRFVTTIYRAVAAGDHSIALLRLHQIEQADERAPGVPSQQARGFAVVTLPR